jgi:hypothetical protein
MQSQVRPQGYQAREHGCRQLLQLVAGEPQKAVEKQKVEKIISSRKQDSIRHRKESKHIVFTIGKGSFGIMCISTCLLCVCGSQYHH